MNEPLRTTSRPVILMRPGEANNRLAELLEAQGIHAVRWPAFSIELPEETDHITERLSNLDDVEMVVLPSPASVRPQRTGCVSRPSTSRSQRWAKARRA